ncbi:MAG: hypothetical protein LCI00_14530 [Chloroflexi bacterium]|nr:hypothetical protein [Chloroflexota bacterium]MCC6897038.1 hypothetical protein [Anaerolineae bacterium]
MIYKQNNVITVVIFAAFQFIFTLAIVRGQPDLNSICKPIFTEYTHIESRWRWLDTDKVVFSVSQGLPADGFVPNEFSWYQYEPSFDLLTQLSESPYESPIIEDKDFSPLTDIQAGVNGLYENINVSQSGEKTIYPRITQKGASYWLIDSKTGMQFDLGIEAGPRIPIKTLWSSDETRFILQSSVNSVFPIQLGLIEGKTVKLQRLSDIPPILKLGEIYRYNGFVVIGFSPSGNHILIQPETVEYELWLIDINNEQITTLNFTSYEFIPAIWFQEDNFTVVTNLGLINYNLQTQKINVIATPEQIGIGQLSYGTMSPDGRFLPYYVVYGAGQYEVGMCNIG